MLVESALRDWLGRDATGEAGTCQLVQPGREGEGRVPEWEQGVFCLAKSTGSQNVVCGN